MVKVAKIGCGLVGQGWAAVFAQAGFEVAMYDTLADAADRAVKAMETRLADLVEYNLLEASDAPNVLKRITVASSLDEALDDAIYIQENGPEHIEFKREITGKRDALSAPDVPICSSTSGISASRYCENIAGRHRCLLVHPINPPHLIPAVEIVPTPWTDKNVVSHVTKLMKKCHRHHPTGANRTRPKADGPFAP